MGIPIQTHLQQAYPYLPLVTYHKGTAVKHSNGLWFPALITKLCKNVGVKIEKGEERVKPGTTISTQTLDEAEAFPRSRATLDTSSTILNEIQEDVKMIKEMKEQLQTFAQHQHEWNQAMLGKDKNKNADTSNFPMMSKSVFAGIPGSSTKASAPSQVLKPANQPATKNLVPQKERGIQHKPQARARHNRINQVKNQKRNPKRKKLHPTSVVQNP